MKKTLLIAVAALAAGIISTQAQAVYSQNIVGYVNQVIPGGGQYSMIANPLMNGTNKASSILNQLSVNGGETLFIWNGTGYYVYQYQGLGVGTGLGYQSDWTDAGANPPAAAIIPGDQADTGDGVYWAPEPLLAPGQGFFMLNPNGNETNTYTGTVVLTNNLTIPGGGQYSMLASVLPISGGVTNSTINLTKNFSPSGGETLFAWNGTGYYVYQYQGAGVGTGLGYQSDWTDAGANPPSAPIIPGDQADTGDGVYWAPTPVLGVGQGFFILNPNGGEQWIQNLTIQ